MPIFGLRANFEIEKIFKLLFFANNLCLDIEIMIVHDAISVL